MNVPAFLLLGLVLLTPGLHAEPSRPGLDILVYGASGKVGRHIVDEALDRGHRVTAVSRDPSRFERRHENLGIVGGDILDPASVARLVAGHDVIVVSVRGVAGDTPADTVPFLGTNNVVDAIRRNGNDEARLIHVGGAGSLEVKPGVLLADRLPKIFMPRDLELEVAGQVLVLQYLRGVTDVAWTYATPPRSFTGGRRKGVYRTGGDSLMKDERGNSSISRADFAVALIDEAENGRFIQQRYSVAY